MNQPVPFDVFTPELQPQESVEWSGQPNPSVIFHPEDWGMIPFSLLWGGFAIFWLLGASGLWTWVSNKTAGDKAFGWFGVIWGTPFVLFGQYMIWGRFVYKCWEKRRTYYALTNRRALIVQERIT